MRDSHDRKQSESLTDTLTKVGGVFKHISWILRAVFAVVLVVIGIQTGLTIKHIHDMGWSFKNNAAEIEITEKEYDDAMNCWAALDYIGAEKCFAKALKSSDEKNGTGSVESAAISQKLGALCLEEGKYNEAYDLLNNAYVTFKKEFGEADGNTIIARGQIAVYDIKKGNFESGLATLNDLYDKATFFGHKIQISQMIAQCNTELGNFKKAIEWYDVLGKLYYQFEIKNLGRVNLLNDYGILMMTIGNYQEAVLSLTNAVSTWEELELQEDNTIAKVYSNLAQAYAWNHQWDLAEEAQEKALGIEKKLYGNNNIYVALSYNSLSRVYGAMNNAAKQKEYLDEALEMALNTVGKNHMATAAIYYDLGEFYSNAGEFDKAAENHTEALEIRKNILGNDNINTVHIYEALTEDNRQLHQYEKSIENAEYAIKISEGLYGRENLYSAHSYITAAWCYSDSGNHERASQLAQMAIAICDRQKNNAGTTRPYAYQTMGYVYLNNSDFENAEKYFEKAIQLYQDSQGPQEENIAAAYLLLSDAYLGTEDFNNCLKSLVEAKNILAENEHQDRITKDLDSRLHGLYNMADTDLDYNMWILTEEKRISDNQEKRDGR